MLSAIKDQNSKKWNGTGWDGLWDGLNIEITQFLPALGRRDGSKGGRGCGWLLARQIILRSPLHRPGPLKVFINFHLFRVPPGSSAFPSLGPLTNHRCITIP